VEQYDVVTSFCMLHWVKDLTHAFSNMNRALKARGKMLIVFPVSYKSPWHDILFSVCRDEKWWKYFHTRSDMQEVSQDLVVNEAYLETICAASHFTPQEIEMYLFNYTFPSVVGYENWFKALSYIYSVPLEEQEMFLREHVDKVVEYGRQVLHDSDDGVSVYIMYAVVDAVKSAAF
jgi:trans-aconitate methyltransferase